MKKEQGVALITVLWVMVLLMVIVTEFAHSMKTEVNITRNLKEEMEAYFLAKAGVNLAIAEIVQDATYHYLDSNGDLVFGERGEAKRTDIALGPGEISYSIIDEESKLNINSSSKDILGRFFERMGGSDTDTIADSILDWIDEDDDLIRVNGAEDDYYMSLSPPYECKDAPLDTTDELLLVKGITSDTFYGGGETRGIKDYITVKSSGINFNTASLAVLSAVYGEERAQEIIQQREERGGIYSETSKSAHFTIIATGKMAQSPITSSIKVRVGKVSEGNRRGIRIDAWDDDFMSREVNSE